MTTSEATERIKMHLMPSKVFWGFSKAERLADGVTDQGGGEGLMGKQVHETKLLFLLSKIRYIRNTIFL